jgi:hypothetical protein
MIEASFGKNDLRGGVGHTGAPPLRGYVAASDRGKREALLSGSLTASQKAKLPDHRDACRRIVQTRTSVKLGRQGRTKISGERILVECGKSGAGAVRKVQERYPSARTDVDT